MPTNTSRANGIWFTEFIYTSVQVQLGIQKQTCGIFGAGADLVAHPTALNH